MTVEIRYPVAGVITAFTTVSAANGSFSFANVPFGIHSIAVTNAPTLGPVQIIVDKNYLNLPSATLNYGTSAVPPILTWDASLGNGTGYPGNGCAYTLFQDISDNRNYGVLSNFGAPCPPGHGEGWEGAGTAANPYGLDFKASRSRSVTMPQNILQSLSTSTIEAWVNSTAGGVILGMHNAAVSNYVPVLYFGADKKLRGQMWQGAISPITTPGVVADGDWHFIALTMNVNTQSLYVDDVLIGTLAGALTPLDMNLNSVGVEKTASWPSGNGGNYYYDGTLAYLTIYNVEERTAAQIKSDCPSLVSRFSGATCN
jgi:hypothetical protein